MFDRVLNTTLMKFPANDFLCKSQKCTENCGDVIFVKLLNVIFAKLLTFTKIIRSRNVYFLSSVGQVSDQVILDLQEKPNRSAIKALFDAEKNV